LHNQTPSAEVVQRALLLKKGNGIIRAKVVCFKVKNKIPISLIIDDPAPVVSVYHAHSETGFTLDGRPLIPHVPNDFLSAFCDVVQQNGLKGKFSVIPMPGNQGDILSGLHGVEDVLVKEWLDLVKGRLVPSFTVGPEMLSHHKAVDLATGLPLEQREDEWAATKDRTQLAPYIAHALAMLKEAGFQAFGVTSPWAFAIEVEEEYAAAISKAVYDVTGRRDAWYFLRTLKNTPNAKPWVAYAEGDRTVVSIPGTTDDHFWQTIDTTETSDEYVSKVADELITEDGSAGEIIRVLETGGYPIILTHWQSLFSNGLRTGLRALNEVGRRIRANLADRVEWMSFEDILHLVIQNQEEYPKR